MNSMASGMTTSGHSTSALYRRVTSPPEPYYASGRSICVANEKVSGVHSKPLLSSQKVDNIQRCVTYLDHQGVDVQGLTAEELADGDLKSTLVLMNNIRKRYDPQYSQRDLADGVAQPLHASSRSSSSHGRFAPGTDIPNGLVNNGPMPPPRTPPAPRLGLSQPSQHWTQPTHGASSSATTTTTTGSAAPRPPGGSTSSTQEALIPGTLGGDGSQYLSADTRSRQTVTHASLVSTTELDQHRALQRGVEGRRPYLPSQGSPPPPPRQTAASYPLPSQQQQQQQQRQTHHPHTHMHIRPNNQGNKGAPGAPSPASTGPPPPTTAGQAWGANTSPSRTRANPPLIQTNLGPSVEQRVNSLLHTQTSTPRAPAPPLRGATSHLLNGDNTATYEDGELLIPPRHKVHGGGGGGGGGEGVDNAGLDRDSSDFAYVPSRPSEKQAGPRGEVFLDTSKYPDGKAHPGGTGMNQDSSYPPRYQPPPQYTRTGEPDNMYAGVGSRDITAPPPKSTAESNLRNLCNRMYSQPSYPAAQRAPPPAVSQQQFRSSPMGQSSSSPPSQNSSRSGQSPHDTLQQQSHAVPAAEQDRRWLSGGGGGGGSGSPRGSVLQPVPQTSSAYSGGQVNRNVESRGWMEPPGRMASGPETPLRPPPPSGPSDKDSGLMSRPPVDGNLRLQWRDPSPTRQLNQSPPPLTTRPPLRPLLPEREDLGAIHKSANEILQQHSRTSNLGVGTKGPSRSNYKNLDYETELYQLQNSSLPDRAGGKDQWRDSVVFSDDSSMTPPLPPLSPSNTPPITPPGSPGPSPRSYRGIVGGAPLGNPHLPAYLQTKTPDVVTSTGVGAAAAAAQRKRSSGRKGSGVIGVKTWDGHSKRATNGRATHRTSPARSTYLRNPRQVEDPDSPIDDSDEDDDDDLVSTNASNTEDQTDTTATATATAADSAEMKMIRRQMEGLEGMYTEILKMMGVDKEYLPGSRRSVSSLSSISRMQGGVGRSSRSKSKAYAAHRQKKEIKQVNKRFSRLESHVVTLARSVAHLSSEMRTQNDLYQEIDTIKKDIGAIRKERQTAPSEKPIANEWDKFRGWIPSISNPKRVQKLAKFFGKDRLLHYFLEKLGYQKYMKNFENEEITILELPYMNEERLEKLGIPMGPRQRILQEAQMCFRQENFNIYIV